MNYLEGKNIEMDNVMMSYITKFQNHNYLCEIKLSEIANQT